MFIQSQRWAFAGLMAAAVAVGCGLSNVDDDDDVVGAVCEADADDSDCDVCIKTGCCDSYAACQDQPNCMCVLNCANDEQTAEVCAGRCNVTADEIANVLTVLNGENQTCTVQCEDECTVYDFADYDDI